MTGGGSRQIGGCGNIGLRQTSQLLQQHPPFLTGGGITAVNQPIAIRGQGAANASEQGLVRRHVTGDQTGRPETQRTRTPVPQPMQGG